MSLNATNETIFSLFKDCVFIVPVNQRKYIWDERNWAELLNDLFLVCKENNRDHFIGSIVFKKEESDNGIREHLSVIDGQQRIITFACLFISLGLRFALENLSGKVEAIKRHLIAKDNNSISYPIVSDKANKSVSTLSMKMNQISGPIDSTESFFSGIGIEKSIIKCVQFFFNQIKTLSIDYVDALLNSIDSTRFVQISAENDEDAYSIFEVLNARGQALSNFDLLRNYILKYTDEANREMARKQLVSIEESLGLHCDSFLRHYVIHKYKIGQEKKRKIISYKIIVNNEKANNKLEFMKDLNLKAGYYEKIINPEICTGIEKKVFSFYKSRKQQQFRPLLLGLMHHHYETKKLIIDKYESCLEDLFRFFVCYNVIGDQTSNKIDDIVDKYSYLIENEFDEKTIENMKKSLSKRIPSYDYFSNRVGNIRYSNKYKAFSGSVKENNVKAILEIIEILHGSQLDFSSIECSVEHCFPDYISDSNALIGNLVLLEPMLNEQVKNKSIQEKINFYQKSIFETPKMIASLYQEGKSLDISARSSEIAKELYDYISNY